MITDRDIRDAVIAAVTPFVADHDIDGIVDQFIAEFGLVSPDTTGDHRFWEIVQQHAK